MNKPFAVIFTAELTGNLEDYDATSARMRELAMTQPGFLGIENVTEGRREITVSYWKSLDDIRAWKVHEEHLQAQDGGRRKWYNRYKVEVVQVVRAYEFGT